MRRERRRFFLGFLAGGLFVSFLGVSTGGVSGMAATRYQDLELFTSVLRLVRDNYVEPVEDHELVEGAVRGMLSGLDPHSSYLDPSAHREMQVDTRGEFHGLGIEIVKRRDGFVEVVAPIDGTPASRAGILARDQVVAICPTEQPEDWTEPCRSTKPMDLHQAVGYMRGRKGTDITIHVMREGFDSPEPIVITRDVVKVASVEGRLLEPGYGYVRIRSFQERTVDDLRDEIERLREEGDGAFSGFVLDLRDNPGGLLDQAVKVADVWLEEGLIVYTQGRVESQRQEFRARKNGERPGYPMVVLVNAGSASASEIVAGALQDQARALLLGTQTFGKGSVQTVFPLERGGRREGPAALRLTTALYYTPSGRSIQEVGIEPDIIVEPGENPLAAGPQALRERDLERHFTQQDAAPGAEPDASGVQAEPEDVQLARAVEVLKSWTYFERLRDASAARAATLPPAGPRVMGSKAP